MVVMSGGGIPDIGSMDEDRRAPRGHHEKRHPKDTWLEFKPGDNTPLTKLPENVIEVPKVDDGWGIVDRIRKYAENGRKLNNEEVGEKEEHNNDTPIRTRLKTPQPKNAPTTKMVVVKGKPEDPVLIIPPDDPEGPGKHTFSAPLDISVLFAPLWWNVLFLIRWIASFKVQSNK